MADDETPDLPDRSEHFQRDTDDVHRAIGRYVVEFSRIIFIMREALIRIVAPNGIYWYAAGLAFGESNASQIANAFFAVCDDRALDEDDLKIIRGLEKQVREAIKTRNDFAHGDWWVGIQGPRGMEAPFFERVKPTRRAGPYELRKVSAAELDGLSDALVTLRDWLWEVGAIRRGKHPTQVEDRPHPSGIGTLVGPVLRYRDFFVVKKDGSIARDGPNATTPCPARW